MDNEKLSTKSPEAQINKTIYLHIFEATVLKGDSTLIPT